LEKDRQELLTKAEAERAVLCKHLDGKALFLAVLRMYAAIHRELRASLLTEEQQTEDFREQRRRKRNSSEEEIKKTKTSKPTPGPRDTQDTNSASSHKELLRPTQRGKHGN
jgi:hypothetical protein